MPRSSICRSLPRPARVLLPILLLTATTGCDPIRTPGFEQLGTSSAAAERQSVNPGINEPYLRNDVDPDAWAQRFEVESREVYAARQAIADTVNLRRSMEIADVGAGTGLFVPLFAERVGTAGRVYAVDIVPAFVKHVSTRARDAGLNQIEARLCSEDSIDLPTNSVDLVFVCDTYHHFEYPAATLASIHDALRPGGQLVIVDFERIPGVSTDWVLNHVRAGKEIVTAEITQAGFTLLEEPTVPGLHDNYMLRFRKAAK